MSLRFNKVLSITPVSGEGGGGGSAKKYGVDINAILGDVDENGVLQPANVEADLVFTGVKKFSGSYTENVLRETFKCTGIKSVSFPDLEEWNSQYDGQDAFSRCPNLVSFSVPKLKTIKGDFFNSALQYSGIKSVSFPVLEALTSGSIRNTFSYSELESLAFPELVELSGWDGGVIQNSNCTKLTSLNFPKLKTILRNKTLADNSTSFQGKIMFDQATMLESITFPALDEIGVNRALSFRWCYALKHIYFPALKTTSFYTGLTDFGYNMLQGVTGCTVHFPVGLDSVIGNWSSVTNGFGGTNTVVLFDLEATE